ncbi:MAG TPA: hypothetical protein PKD68_05090 [Candidatus Saccharibacteria bacterium]|nr:hypothetical protein [Candidatus Saccharibacteria bacterium]
MPYIVLNSYPSPEEIAFHGAISLAQDNKVNGLYYNKGTINSAEGMDVTGKTLLLTALYYPPGVVTENGFSVGIQTSPDGALANDAVQEVLCGGYEEQLIQRFSLSPGTAAVVDFARSANRENVPLVEKRNLLLRDYSSPLAAVAIWSSGHAYAAVISAPYFVWPWAALSEMRAYLEDGPNDL